MLMETVNGKTMDEKLKELQIKMWRKYKRAPKYLLQNETFKQWIEYIERNDDTCKALNGALTINPVKLNYVSKSPLSRAYNTVKSLYPNYGDIIDDTTTSICG